MSTFETIELSQIAIAAARVSYSSAYISGLLRFEISLKFVYKSSSRLVWCVIARDDSKRSRIW